MPRSSSVRMREPDPLHADYHLLEEISKPQACLSAGRISVWVYHDQGLIREVVIAGHAESVTCASATSILIEAAKDLDDSVSWMLTCGAAFFRVAIPERPSFFLSQSGSSSQTTLRRMITALQEVADEKGLIEIVHQDWQRLIAFREGFQSCAAATATHIVEPRPAGPAQVVDYVPILPRGTGGKALTFRLEGWDFDCPAFQAVADRHLRKVQRELLRDALRRRRTYRGWLKECAETWVDLLGWLPREEADQVLLEVPPAADAKEGSAAAVVTPGLFFREHVARFLDRGQEWHQSLAYAVEHMEYGQVSRARLKEEIQPERVTEFDFQRLVRRTREGTEGDRFTMLERITTSDPNMVSVCLRYIRDMDRIIAPYEELRSGRHAGASRKPGSGNRAVRAVEDISKQIVMETMVRGWPSVYLDDKEDRAVFAAWSDEYRPRVWKILARQAKLQGVALEVLLEDNVVYDVRFDDDLGCVIQPLMLVDDATHVQLHGSRTGASVAIPLWPRRSPQTMPSSVLALGATNRERAARLVQQASQLTFAPNPNPRPTAEKLRQALACHPAEAGKLILREWSRRLGRDTSAEFESARDFIEAAELLRRDRYIEARTAMTRHLGRERRPLADAYVIAAIAALHQDATTRAALRKTGNDYERIARRHDELVKKLEEQQASGQRMSMTDLESLKAMRREAERLGKTIEARQQVIATETARHRELIGKALQSPDDVRFQYPELALAAERAAAALRNTLENECEVQTSREVVVRYGDVRRIIEARGLLDIIYALSLINYRIENDANTARRETLGQMERLTSATWLPVEIESDMRSLHEEFAKGDWDRLQSLQILSIIQEAISTCHARMLDLVSSRIVSGTPLKESIATRIHITHILESKYKTALDMLLGADVAFGGAVDQPWTIIDDELAELPESCRFVFDSSDGSISVEANGTRAPLLRAAGLSSADCAYVEETLAAGDLPDRLNPFAPSIADALLALEVAPRQEWRNWRDALALLQTELIAALSGFGYETNLMPDHAPPTIDTGEDLEARWNQMTPRTYPIVDRSWPDLGVWQKLAPQPVDRSGVAF